MKAVNGHLSVREMTLAEIGIRSGYFHGATDQHLDRIGVGRDLLPTPDEFRSSFEADLARPMEERQNVSLVWELDDSAVGFSSLDRTTFGEEAFMHLHLLQAENRRRGLGAEFVRRSTPIHFERLHLQRLYCEPNALNLAPNRTLQAAGFRYEFSHESAPTPMNPLQIVTRWLLERPN